MTSYVSARLRRLVADRARQLCEYCLIHEQDTFLGCQVEHIISEKHSEIGEATAALLGFNHPDRLLEREALAVAGRYPSKPARWLMGIA